MTSWHKGPLCAFDTETSGVDVERERIVTATVARITPGAEATILSELIAVDVDIPEQATAVHGITTEHARANGKPAAEVLDLVAAELAHAMYRGVPVVGCNVSVDFTILDRELRRNGLPTLEDRLGGPIGPVVDVYVLDKAVDRYRRGGRKLTDLCEHYRVRIDGAHDATADAMAAARVAWRIAENHQAISRLTLAELHASQVEWRAEQQASLAEYFRKQGKDASDVDGSWPIRPYRPEQVEEVLVG